jgi:hypothetical protein
MTTSSLSLNGMREPFPPLHPHSVGHRSIINLNLLRQQQGARLTLQANGMELDLVGRRRSKPRASHDAQFSPVKAQFGEVGHESDVIVDVRLSHENL